MEKSYAIRSEGEASAASSSSSFLSVIHTSLRALGEDGGVEQYNGPGIWEGERGDDEERRRRREESRKEEWVCLVSVAMTLMILYCLYPSTYCGVGASEHLPSLPLLGKVPERFSPGRVSIFVTDPGRRTGLKQTCRFFFASPPLPRPECNVSLKSLLSRGGLSSRVRRSFPP